MLAHTSMASVDSLARQAACRHVMCFTMAIISYCIGFGWNFFPSVNLQNSYVDYKNVTRRGSIDIVVSRKMGDISMLGDYPFKHAGFYGSSSFFSCKEFKQFNHFFPPTKMSSLLETMLQKCSYSRAGCVQAGQSENLKNLLFIKNPVLSPLLGSSPSVCQTNAAFEEAREET